MVDDEGQAEGRAGEADALERKSARVGEEIEGVREDWERKRRDSSVPGAQPDPGEGEEPVAGIETNPREVRDQGGRDMEGRRAESNQLPEEGPAEQVPDDAAGEAREGAQDTPGRPGEAGTATGNPAAAGAREPDESG